MNRIQHLSEFFHGELSRRTRLLVRAECNAGAERLSADSADATERSHGHRNHRRIRILLLKLCRHIQQIKHVFIILRHYRKLYNIRSAGAHFFQQHLHDFRRRRLLKIVMGCNDRHSHFAQPFYLMQRPGLLKKFQIHQIDTAGFRCKIMQIVELFRVHLRHAALMCSTKCIQKKLLSKQWSHSFKHAPDCIVICKIPECIHSPLDHIRSALAQIRDLPDHRLRILLYHGNTDQWFPFSNHTVFYLQRLHVPASFPYLYFFIRTTSRHGFFYSLLHSE